MGNPAQISNLIPAAVQPSQVPAKHESSAPKSGEEQKFEIALSEARICHVHQDELKNVLRYVMVLVGLRAQNYPDDIEKQILLNFIADNYGGHTPAEIKLAFEMAITKKLDVESNCYENFSVAYFVSIMEAYRSWAREQIKQLPAPVITRQLTAMETVDINLVWALKCLNEINKLPVVYDSKTRKISKGQPVR
jgi:hypothetical protein